MVGELTLYCEKDLLDQKRLFLLLGRSLWSAAFSDATVEEQLNKRLQIFLRQGLFLIYNRFTNTEVDKLK